MQQTNEQLTCRFRRSVSHCFESGTILQIMGAPDDIKAMVYDRFGLINVVEDYNFIIDTK